MEEWMIDVLDNSGDQGTLGVIEEMGKWNQGWVDGGIIRTAGLKGGRRDSEGEERWGRNERLGFDEPGALRRDKHGHHMKDGE